MKIIRRLTLLPTAGGLAASACLCFLPTPAVAAAVSCPVTASVSDFNGDGYDDAAVGDPYATVGGVRQAGAVTVLLGDADGRVGEGRREVITRATFGESPAIGDHFGYDVALAPTGNPAGCAKLLIGAPGVDVDEVDGAGTAYLVSDLPDVEGTPSFDVVPLTQADARGTVEEADGFGSAVAITGTNQEDRQRLVVGAPGEDAGAVFDVGAVNVFELDEDGPIGLAELRQGERGPLGAVRLPGTPQAGDRFGSSLAVGVMDLPEVSGIEAGQTLVIGAPGDTVSGRAGAGSVTVLQEKYEAAVLLTQATRGVTGTPETGDQFGASVALLSGTRTAGAILAVGAPREDGGSTKDTGTVTVFDNVGEQIRPRTVFSQATKTVPGANEAGDRFGSSLAFGHHGTTLLVGIPREDLGTIKNAGAVQPVQVSGTQPLRFPPALSENAAGTAGSVGTDNQFGLSLSALSGGSEHLLTISSPYALGGSVYVRSDGTSVPPRSWVAAAGQRFGWSVSS